MSHIINYGFAGFVFILIIKGTCFSQDLTSADRSGVYSVTVENVTMLVSQAGGRIVSFKYDQDEVLTQCNEHENFGSTLWTSPQSVWGWPPYKVLDEKEYECSKSGDSLWLRSEADSVSGFQMEKVFRPDYKNNGITITYIIRNISKVRKSLGAWEVTRVPAGDLSFFPKGKFAGMPESNLMGVSESKGIKWFIGDQVKFDGGQKFFSTAENGWLAHIHKNILFVKVYPDIKVSELAPMQGEVEIYADGNRIYEELENQGAFQVLMPGESLKYKVGWYLRRLPVNVEVTRGNMKLVREVLKMGL